MNLFYAQMQEPIPAWLYLLTVFLLGCILFLNARVNQRMRWFWAEELMEVHRRALFDSSRDRIDGSWAENLAVSIGGAFTVKARRGGYEYHVTVKGMRSGPWVPCEVWCITSNYATAAARAPRRVSVHARCFPDGISDRFPTVGTTFLGRLKVEKGCAAEGGLVYEEDAHARRS